MCRWVMGDKEFNWSGLNSELRRKLHNNKLYYLLAFSKGKISQ